MTGLNRDVYCDHRLSLGLSMIPVHFSAIINHVSKHISLTGEEATRFCSLLEFKTLPRKSVLLKTGDPCTVISYVNSGALRAFYQGEDDKESTIMFAIADWWITDMHSFVNQTPALVNIEVIEDCSLVQFSKTNLERLFVEIPKFERLFRIMMQNAYIREQLRVLQNLSKPAEVRYKNFILKYPQIANRVTQKQIASYLGITPEFLSTIRKNRATKKS
jgi:CRP-like cAMP-binding protein